MPLTLAEFHIRKRLQRRSVILLFDAACLLGWTSIRAIAELAGVKYDHARVELGKLVEAGWLIREDRGPAKRGQVRYRSPVIGVTDRHTDHPRSVTPITGDRYSLEGSRARPDPDPDPADRSLGNGSKTVPSVRPGGSRGETDGRTAEVFEEPLAELTNALVLRTAAQWRLSPRVVTPGILRLLNARATERELHAFLADAERAARGGVHPAFDGVGEENRFGRSCTAERFVVWRRSQAAKVRAEEERARIELFEHVEPRRAPHAVSEASAFDIEDFVRHKLAASMRGKAKARK